MKQTVQAPWWGIAPWSWFYSLRIGLVLLVLITIASIAGTLIPPITGPDGQVQLSSLERSQRLIYYSPWYLAMLWLLAINIGAATARTILLKVIPALRPRVPRGGEFFAGAGPRAEIPFGGDPARVEAELRRAGLSVWREGGAGYATRGRAALWGAPVAHLGMVVVLLAGFSSSFVAREGTIQLVEGQETQWMTPRGGDGQPARLGFTLTCEDFDIGHHPRTRIPSHFISTVRIKEPGEPARRERVEVNHSPAVRGWRLHQTSYQELNGRRQRLALWHPELAPTTQTLELSAGQSRPLSGAEGVEVALGEGQPPRWTIRAGEQLLGEGALGQPAMHLCLRAERFEPDFTIDSASRTATSRSTELNNPALLVHLSSGGQELAHQWLFYREDLKAMMHAADGPYAMELVEIAGEAGERVFTVALTERSGGTPVGALSLGLGREACLDTPAAEPVEAAGPWQVALVEQMPLYMTVLTVTRNPAIPVVYLGCALMMLGLVLAFAIQRREVWFVIDEAAGRLRLAAAYRHAREDFDGRLAGALARLAEPAAHDSAKRDSGKRVSSNVA